jgi:hypothetical protein
MLSINEELVVTTGGESASLELLVRQLCEKTRSGGSGAEERQSLLQRIDAVGVGLRCVATEVYRYGTVVRGPADFPAEARLAEIERELRELRIALQQNVPDQPVGAETLATSEPADDNSAASDCSAVCPDTQSRDWEVAATPVLYEKLGDKAPSLLKVNAEQLRGH